MKAKRILSLLLTVAMIAACSITSFAAFTDATATVKIDVDVVEITADEMDEYGFEVADGEYMYWIIGTISDYGVIEAGSVANKGYKLKSASVLMYVGDNEKVSSTLYLTPGEDNYENWSTTDYGDIGTAAIAAQASDDYFAMGFSASEDSSKSYPNTRNTTVSDSIVFAKFPVVAKTNNFVCNVYTKTASFAEFSGKTAKVEGTDKEYTAYPGEVATITGNTSVTIGGTPGPVGPDVKDTTAIANNGITIGEVTYDNAFGVNASITPDDNTTEIGVLFAPADWLGTNELTVGLEGAKKVSKTGLVGGTAVDFTAAIKDIPRALTNVSFDMVTRAYATDGTTPVYADAVSTPVCFGNTK